MIDPAPGIDDLSRRHRMQLDAEIAELSAIAAQRPDPSEPKVVWNVYLQYRHRRREAIAMRDRLYGCAEDTPTTSHAESAAPRPEQGKHHEPVNADPTPAERRSHRQRRAKRVTG